MGSGTKNHLLFKTIGFICVIVLTLHGCITHDPIPLVIKVPAFYKNKSTKDGLIVIADPYNERGKARYIFGKDIRKKGVYPIHLIFQNQGDNYFDITKVETTLISEAGIEYKPITHEEASSTILKNTPIRVVAYGLLGSAFLVLTVPFAVSAGVSSYRTNKTIKKDFNEKQFAKELIKPHEMSHGFIFFSLKIDDKKISIDDFKERYSIKLRSLNNIKTGETFDLNIPIS